MENNDDSGLVEVFAGTMIQAGMVKSLLENAEIKAFLVNEIMGTLNPWWTAPGGAGSVSVTVPGRDYEKAKLIVAEYEKNLKNSK